MHTKHKGTCMYVCVCVCVYVCVCVCMDHHHNNTAMHRQQQFSDTNNIKHTTQQH